MMESPPNGNDANADAKKGAAKERNMPTPDYVSKIPPEAGSEDDQEGIKSTRKISEGWGGTSRRDPGRSWR